MIAHAHERTLMLLREVEYRKVCASWGWKAALVMTSFSSSMLRGLMSTTVKALRNSDEHAH
jgi:hypothetical protein